MLYMKKTDAIIAVVLIYAAIFIAIGGMVAMKEKSDRLREAAEESESRAEIAEGERDNAKALAAQYKEQYSASVMEIAALKAEVEELTRRSEELAFALDEVCYETGWTSLGEFTLTYYCPCEKCCGKWANGVTATGTAATEGRTVAVDPKIIPLGSTLDIGGHTYIAEDTGVKGRVIDVFVNSHEEALRLGTCHRSVSIAVGRGA